MKKITLLFVSVVLCFETFGQHKVKIEKVDPDSTGQDVVTERTRANHWSISGTLGAGWIDGDQIKQGQYSFPRSWAMLSGTLNLEYTISPILGFYAEYFYNPYGGHSRYINQNNPDFGIDFYQHRWNPTPGVEYEFKGVNHEISLGTSLNILNIFYKCRPQIIQWYANVGIGYSFYGLTEHFASGTNIQTNDIMGIIPKAEDKSRSVTFPIGTTVEWNATRWLAVLAKVDYRVHHEDNYDASVCGNSNDNTLYGGLGLRWKINSATNKNLYHIRDMAIDQFIPDDAKGLKKSVDSLKNDVGDLKKKVNNLIPRVNALEKDMDKLRDSDEDGVPDIRDREPNTPRGNKVNYWGETIKDEPTNTSSVISDDNCLSIYYPTATFSITPVSQITLAEVARIMSVDPGVKLQINSYADEQGVKTGFNNQKLTDNRAKTIKEVLVKEYGIDVNRIIEVRGHGSIKGQTIDYMPNRRSDICFVK